MTRVPLASLGVIVSASAPARRSWLAVIGVSVVGSLAVALVVMAFLWPSKTSTVQDVPLAIAGDEASVSQVADMLEENASGTFDVIEVEDRDEAVDLIETREVYGAIVLAAPPATPEVLTASAGNAAVAQMLAGIAAQLQQQVAAQIAAAGGDPTTVTVPVTDVVPLTEADPNGSGLAAAAFPLTLGGMLAGILVSFVITGAVRRTTALVVFSALAGTLITVVLDTWFEYLAGDFWLNAAAVSLAVLATGAFIAGCNAVLGRAGLALAAVFTMLVANPLSAAAVPWQFLAAPWGEIGQYLVPGASNALLRSVSYFPEAATGTQWLVLAAWAVGGILLVLLGALRRGDRTDASAPDASTPA